MAQQQLPDYVQLEEKLPDYVALEKEPVPEKKESFLSRAWKTATTPLLPVEEPTMEQWSRSPMWSATQSALSQATSPLAIVGELAGGIGMLRGLRGMRNRVPQVASTATKKLPTGAEIPGTGLRTDIPVVKVPESDFLAEMAIRPKFNPKGQTGLTGQAQKPAQSIGNKITIKKPTQELVNRLRKEGYSPGGVGEDGYPFMIKNGKPINIDEIPIPAPEKASLLREAYNLPRGLMSVDPPFMTSAAFRQALPLTGTRNWFSAWKTAAKVYGNEDAYKQLMARIENHPLVKRNQEVNFRNGRWVKTEKPSVADEFGVKFTDLGELGTREEAIRSTLAEKMPGLWGKAIRASNRSYTGFLNELRLNTLDDLVKTYQANGIDPIKDLTIGKQIGEFINDATGRGSLKLKILPESKLTGSGTINLEQSAKVLSDGLFSPRLVFSRLRMLNPATYLTTDPIVRKQYLYANLRAIGSWWGIASLAELSGVGSVSKDPSNADFGKIRIGNTRLDPGGGFQQWLVLANRLRPKFSQLPVDTKTGVPPIDLFTNLLAGTGAGGITSSTSRQHYDFGKGFRPSTRGSTSLDFAANKLHPVAKMIWDMYWAEEGRPVYMTDRTMQLFLPMVSQDLVEIMQEDPSITALIGAPLFTGVGGGMQTYEKGTPKPIFTPLLGLDEYDFAIGR